MTIATKGVVHVADAAEHPGYVRERDPSTVTLSNEDARLLKKLRDGSVVGSILTKIKSAGLF
jgi:hypothetical protein